MARVKLIQKDTALPEIKELFQKIEDNGNSVLNLFKALGHSPKIGRDFIRFGNSILFKGGLPERLRELAILRVANLTNANYEWTQHVRVALETGVPMKQIDAIHDWINSTEFDDTERAILQYTDEETQMIRVSDETFARVRNIFSEKEVIELTVTIGFYGMVARILETLQIELE